MMESGIQYIQKQNNSGNLVTFKTMHYNKLGQLDYEIDGDNNTTSYEYDVIGRKTKTIFANNNTIQIIYDDVNRKVTTIDENGNKTVTYMDEIGRQTKTDRVDVANNKTVTTTTDYEYNGDPFQTRIVDYNSKATVYKNNGLNLLSKVTQNVNGIDQMTNYKYNNLGLVTQKILADNTTVNYSYDETGRLLSETNQQQLVVWNQYDLNNNLIKNTDKNGVAANLSYDEQNRLTQQIKGTLTTSYTYYKNNLRKTMVDSTGTTQYTYYKDNLLHQITFPDLKTIQYEYDTAGNRTKLTEPFTQVWNYNYDQQNRLDYMTIGASQTREIDINYKPNGLIDMATQANGMKAIYSFDGLNRLTGLAHKNSAGTVVGSYGYTNDSNGNILTKAENGTTNTFTYDEVNRILTNTQGNEIYTYDKTGNRATLSATSSFITDDTMDYTYDEYNRLIQVKKNDVIVSTNKYNGDGLLVEQTENGVTTRYYYDGANIIAEGTVAVNGTVSLKSRYLRAGTQLVSKEDNTGLKGYYLQNGHGDVVELRNTAGNVLASYTYDIWGNSLTVNESGMTSLFRYSGELWDSTVSLQYLRARWYDPSIGRFISEDTFEGQIDNPLSLNLYAYVNNNPILYTDPSGNVIETAWDVINVGLDGLDIGLDIYTGSWWDLLIDIPSLAVDVGATAAPGIPGGVGTLKSPLRAGKVLKTYDKVSDLISSGNKLDWFAKAFLRREARDFMLKNSDNFAKAVSDGQKLEVHHVIPLEWAHLMGEGFDPNSLSNLAGVSKDVHKQINNMWNEFRERFKKAGYEPTVKDIMEQVAKTIKNYGENFVK